MDMHDHVRRSGEVAACVADVAIVEQFLTPTRLTDLLRHPLAQVRGLHT